MSNVIAFVHVCVTKSIIWLTRKDGGKKALACTLDRLYGCVGVTLLSRTLS